MGASGETQQQGQPREQPKQQREFPTKAFAASFSTAFDVIKYALQGTAAVLLAYGAVKLAELLRTQQAQQLLESAPSHQVTLSTLPSLAMAALLMATLLAAAVAWGRIARRPTYLLDFAVYLPPEECRCTYNRVMHGARRFKVFDDQSLEFMDKILLRSGLGVVGTYLPHGFHTEPHQLTWERAKEEAEAVMFGVVEEALKKTGLKPRDIDVLVTNCSIYNPTPSLAAMIINKFKMRSDIEAYNLGGMGCSAGVLAIGLAQKLLGACRPHGGGYALVVSFENITVNFYPGQDRSMLIPNMIFRMGGAGIVLSNKSSSRSVAKYELEQLLRVHLGASDEAYNAVYQRPDQDGTTGVSLSKALVRVASRALEANLTRLGPRVLPLSEKLLFAANWVARKVVNGGKCGNGRGDIAPYVPDFKRAFDHFCLHAGGKAVVDGISKQLGLDERRMAPSSNTLRWYGNTSSSTIWYSLAYAESCQGVRTGERAWQVGFGSGFKCNSAVWRALRPITQQHAAWAHLDESGRLRPEVAEGLALEYTPEPGFYGWEEYVARKQAAEEEGRVATEKKAHMADPAEAQARPVAEEEGDDTEGEAAGVAKRPLEVEAVACGEQWPLQPATVAAGQASLEAHSFKGWGDQRREGEEEGSAQQQQGVPRTVGRSRAAAKPCAAAKGARRVLRPRVSSVGAAAH